MQLSFSFHQKKREKKKKVKAMWEGKGKENIVIPQMENDSSFISVYLFPLFKFNLHCLIPPNQTNSHIPSWSCSMRSSSHEHL